MKRRPHDSTSLIFASGLRFFGLSFLGLGLTALLSLQANAQFPSPSSSNLPPSLLPAVNLAPTAIAQGDFDIVDTAEIEGKFDIFFYLFLEAGMQEDLRGFGRFTVFAPTDEAFEAMTEERMTALLSDRELLAQVLTYHVISSSTPVYADDITSITSMRSLERSDLELRPRGDSIAVNDVPVIQADIEAINGVIHAIDEVLIPPDIAGQLP